MSNTDYIFCFNPILEKKLECSEVVHQLFKTSCDTVRREVVFIILIEFVILMKLIRLIKMCLTEHVMKSDYASLSYIYYSE
jgi:hypothetical protein